MAKLGDEKPTATGLEAAFEAFLEDKPNDALTILDSLEETAEARMLRMAALINQGELAQALALERPEDAQNSEIQRLLAYCHAATNDVDGVRLRLNRAWLSGENTQEVLNTYADILRKAGFSDGEAVCVSTAIPSAHTLMANKVLSLISKGELRQALKVSEHYSNDAEDGILVLHLRHFICRILDKNDEAQELERQISEQANEAYAPMAETLNGISELLTGKPELAAEAFAGLQELNAFALLRIQALRDSNQKNEALELALKLHREELGASERLYLSKLLISMGEGERAAALLEYQDDLIENSDYEFRNRYFHAKALLQTEKKTMAQNALEELIVDCKKAYIANPRRVGLCILQCMCHRELGQKQQALEMQSFLRQMFPNDMRIDALL